MTMGALKLTGSAILSLIAYWLFGEWGFLTVSTCLWLLRAGTAGALLSMTVFSEWAYGLLCFYQIPAHQETAFLIAGDTVTGIMCLSIILAYRMSLLGFCGTAAAYFMMFCCHFGWFGLDLRWSYHAALNLSYMVQILATLWICCLNEVRLRRAVKIAYPQTRARGWRNSGVE